MRRLLILPRYRVYLHG